MRSPEHILCACVGTRKSLFEVFIMGRRLNNGTYKQTSLPNERVTHKPSFTFG